MLRIQLEGNIFEKGKPYRIDEKADGSFCKEAFSDKDHTGDKKRKKDKEYTKGQVAAGELADDDGDAGRAVVYGVVGEQDTGYRKAGQQCSDDDGKIRKQGIKFFLQMQIPPGKCLLASYFLY